MKIAIPHAPRMMSTVFTFLRGSSEVGIIMTSPPVRGSATVELEDCRVAEVKFINGARPRGHGKSNAPGGILATCNTHLPS